MRCPYCGYKEDKVVDSRVTQEGSAIRRRRECLSCARRFTTYEYVEDVSLMVIKKDGRRQLFDRKKILTGIMRACEKRPVGLEEMEEITSQVERDIHKSASREVPSSEIGEMIIRRLKKIDDVAYVRFASVYRQFKDVGQFMHELKSLLDDGKSSGQSRKGGKKRRTSR
ncbi:MAG: transcriptional regulator NrdR [Candidatus Omnitrophota bacterium]|jgi:transcriptional repressor NrdR